jgi:hypothetical protein
VHFPTIPTPDDVITYYLKLIFGPSSFIVAVVVVAKSLWSWVGPTRKGVEVVRGGVRLVMGVPPVARAIGLVITAAMLPLQLVWLLATYVVGNGIGYFFGNRPGWTGSPDWSVFIKTMRWDWVSQVYVAAAVVVLVVAYVATFRGRDDAAHSGVGLLALPLMPIGALALLGALLGGLMSVLYMIDTNGASPATIAEAKDFCVKCAAITGMIAAYLIATVTITGTPGLMARIWRPRRA